ncbi:MAG: hypothetical protein AAF840_04325 [Bacteroidota bacterium]
MFLLNDTTAYFADGYRQLTLRPETNTSAKTICYHNRNFKRKGRWIGPPPEKKVDLDLSPAILQAYTGVYQTEHFRLTISLENQHLFAQPDGAEKLPLTAYAKDKFYVPAIGAELEFSADNQGKKTVHILLEGQSFQGRWVK